MAATRRSPGRRPRRRVRWNVLVLVGLGYLVTLVGFGVIVYTGETAAAAYEAIKEPMMALIGGSIALAKDVLQADVDDNTGGQE